MIHINAKPTDTPDDNSTAMVALELDRLGAEYKFLDLEAVDALAGEITGDLIWVCGMKQDAAQFEMLNVLSTQNLVINSPDAIAICASKARTSALLMKAKVPTPETLFSVSRDLAIAFINRREKIVSKPLYGFDGNGIYPLEQSVQLGPPPYYLQDYIENDRDYRVFVLDGEAVGAIMRRSEGFAHNIHQGGTGTAVAVTDEMAEIAIRAADAIGISYCGVDLLEEKGSFTVLEVNGTPNWHCMEAPIPRLLAQYFVEQEHEYRRR